MFRRSTTLMVFVGALALGACGSQSAATPAATTGASATMPTAAMADMQPTVMADMQPTAMADMMPTAAMAGMQPTAAMAGMQPTAMAGGMQMGDAPYDALFIDSMLEHHQGAVAMAKQALNEASKPELKTLAQGIITAQEAEIAQMQSWRKAWYPDLATTKGMGMDMGAMDVSGDTSLPYDQRFLTAMVAHHQGALTMAQDAQTKAEHPEIKALAQNIVTSQQAEITQMQQWQKEWLTQ